MSNSDRANDLTNQFAPKSNLAAWSELAEKFSREDNFIGWFEELYSQANGDPKMIPWANLAVNPNLASWLTQTKLSFKGKKALVVGCGLGDDAEALGNLGCQVTAFDISPSAITWCQKRFLDTSVTYLVSDALQLEATWEHKFDLILESYTLQALPESLRQQIMSNLVKYLAPKGMLLIICRGRDRHQDAGVSPPWALTKEELSFFEKLGLQNVSFEDYLDSKNPPIRRFRIQYIKTVNN